MTFKIEISQFYDFSEQDKKSPSNKNVKLDIFLWEIFKSDINFYCS